MFRSIRPLVSPFRPRGVLIATVLAGAGLLSACGQSAAPEPATPASEPGAAAPSGAIDPAVDDLPITDPPVPAKATGNPLAGAKLWVDPESLAALRANAIRAQEPANAAILDKIAQQPQALWLGEWNSNIYRTVQHVVGKAKAEGAMPVFIAYNLPHRDCGQHSAGGLKGKDDYRQWIRKIHAGIGQDAAVVVLEPDALGLLDKCLSNEQQEERLFLLRDAVRVLRQNPKTVVYLDAGHSRWAPADVMAERLKKAGIDEAHGFALNTSNYGFTEENIEYGKKVSELVGGAPFVIDTSRNGAGPAPNNEWCNPPGRKIGKPPTTETGDPLIDGYLWLKRPGESDGECNGGPKAGVFWLEMALSQAQ